MKFSETKLKNTHIVINNEGKIVSIYHKIHLYDVKIPSRNIESLESNLIEAGNQIVPPVKTPIGNVGLGIVSFFKLALLFYYIFGFKYFYLFIYIFKIQIYHFYLI